MSSSSAPRLFSPPFLIACAVLVSAAMALAWLEPSPLPMRDFFPLYYGADAWVQTGSAYALNAVAPPVYHGYDVLAIGNGYPLPAVLIVLPLSLLPPAIAPVLWVGVLTLGLLLALRLGGQPFWLLLYVPLLESLRNQQYTALIVALLIVAIWSYRTNRKWALAFCCALLLTKPSQGTLPALVLVLLARNWREQLAAALSVWGLSLLLDPNWPNEWLAALANYSALTNQPVYWLLAAFALPLLLGRDWIGAALVLQLALFPFPIGFYAAAALPLGVLHDPRSKWLMVASFLLPFPALWLGQAWAIALVLLLPVVALALLRWRESLRATQADAQVHRS
ncbi:MAG: DUF2029 domain-containing protein [Chloroflexales bacterium]|nr:DUF2029 domain-containing protein [Chloroflexales bacterium]